MLDFVLMSETIMPSIHVFVKKNNKLDIQRPGTKVLCPKNSSWKPCCNQRTCIKIHIAAAANPSFLRARSDEDGR
jgi:hypothetical protein